MLEVSSLLTTFRRLWQRSYIFAATVGLLFVIPIAGVTLARHATIAPLQILSGCCGFRPVVSDTTPNLIPSDVTDFVLPDRFFVKKSLSQGQLPLWNPSYFGGEVFLGNLQSTVLHPVNIFYSVTSELNVQTISVLISLFSICFFMSLLLLELGCRRPAAALGALAFGGSCFAIFWAPFGMMTWAMAGMPLCLYLLLKWYKTKGRHWLGLLSLALGLQWYFGHIQFSFAVYVLVGAFCVYWFLFETKRRRPAVIELAMVLVAMGIGIALGAAQLLPFFEQAKIGHRAGVVLLTQPMNSSGMWLDIKHFLTGYQLIFKASDKVSQMYFFDYGPFRFSIGSLAGLLVLPALLIAIVRPHKNKQIAFFAVTFIVGSLWMWGGLPHQILGALSSNFKSLNPRYFMVIPLFAGAVLSALSFEWLLQYIAAPHRRLQARLNPSLIAGLSLVLLLVGLLTAHLVLAHHHYSRTNQLLFVLPPVLLLIVANVSFRLKSGRALRAVWFLPAALILMQALMIFFTTQPLAPKPLYYAGNPYFDFIVKDSGAANPANVRIVSPFSPQTNLYYGLNTLNGYDSLYAKKTENLIHAINYPKTTFELSAISHNAIYVGNLDKTPLLQNLGVQYAIAATDQQPVGWQKVYSEPGQGFAVFKSLLPGEQVYFAKSVINGSEAEQLKAIKDGSLGYRQIMMAGPVRTSLVSSPADRLIYDLDINKIHITTSSKTSQQVFIAQNYRPQWRTKIDGQPASLQPADYTFMSLKVPAGNHTIEMIYDPGSFKVGVVISTVMLVLVLGYTVSDRVQRNYQSKTKVAPKGARGNAKKKIRR